mgnify:CR=1 FL=1
MAKEFLTDEAVEEEIARLSLSEDVRLARRELRLKYKRRQQLYTLRALEKRGKELAESGVTIDNIDELMTVAYGDDEDDV